MRIPRLPDAPLVRLASHGVLLTSIVLVLVGWPILRELGVEGRWVLDLFLLLVVAACVAEALGGKPPLVILLSFVLVFEVVTWVAGLRGEPAGESVRHVLFFLALMATAGLLLRGVFRSLVVDVDALLGAVCVYLLLGMAWTELYVLIDIHDPGAFSSAVNPGAPRLDPRLTLSYFSYVTLTTLGYGDVTPVNAAARALAGFEALVGQLYIAVIVARLVAVYVSKRGGEGVAQSGGTTAAPPPGEG